MSIGASSSSPSATASSLSSSGAASTATGASFWWRRRRPRGCRRCRRCHRRRPQERLALAAAAGGGSVRRTREGGAVHGATSVFAFGGVRRRPSRMRRSVQLGPMGRQGGSLLFQHRGDSAVAAVGCRSSFDDSPSLMISVRRCSTLGRRESSRQDAGCHHRRRQAAGGSARSAPSTDGSDARARARTTASAPFRGISASILGRTERVLRPPCTSAAVAPPSVTAVAASAAAAGAPSPDSPVLTSVCNRIEFRATHAAAAPRHSSASPPTSTRAAARRAGGGSNAQSAGESRRCASRRG